MNKVALKNIGFKEQNEVNDQWVQQEQQQERSIPDIYIDGSHWFKKIDQSAANLTEDLVMDESGQHYELTLSFTVRTEDDIALAKKYAKRPVVVYAVAVDGSRFTIGTKSYPAYLVTSNRYDAMNTREVQVSVSYQSRTGIMQK